MLYGIMLTTYSCLSGLSDPDATERRHPDSEDGGEMAQTPCPGSCDAGSDQDKGINDRDTAAPAGAGEMSDQDDLERPSPRAVLVITLRRINEATFGRPAGQ
jgi:hypothetical protein